MPKYITILTNYPHKLRKQYIRCTNVVELNVLRFKEWVPIEESNATYLRQPKLREQGGHRYAWWHNLASDQNFIKKILQFYYQN